VNTDFSVTKDTKITERLNLQFRMEMFDIFNNANFGNPILTATSGTFVELARRDSRPETSDRRAKCSSHCCCSFKRQS